MKQRIFNPKRFVALRGKTFRRQYWESEIGNDFNNAWRYVEWLTKKLRASNDPDKDKKIAYLIDTCWEKYPLF